ncbi:MAG: molybdopterin-dependent oxidoreductase [Chloroflexi bacterium]|nr:molybdopterin-dependent oxidoreductase [Chloroflexota bacterium]
MVTITLNGETLEVEAGRPLVEVIKEQGVRITNLCYIDGLEPYAGCRTCLVEIEGARPTELQLSCTAVTADGMAVNTETSDVKRARQQVMSLIMANHPDRCLTCHRRVHCQPGEICLRDDVVTHRCLTCSKNYRCELQTSTELIDMGEYEEPWVGEDRSYYETPPPEVDRANPYLEFDPQMCIICTRCVRACADIRHTGAISLSGKGSTTMIAFGTGGAVHESNCDFCGACIDVCPTATLMEKPNKWMALSEEWTNSACNSCAVGCTISYGLRDGRPMIVRPDRLNPTSRDQICVRGRFHYDAVGDRERLSRSLVREGDLLLPATPENALAEAARLLAGVKEQHGAGAIAVLGSPLATDEEAALLAKLAGDVIGTPHLDFSHGPVHRASAAAFERGLGSAELPSSYSDIEQAGTIVVVGGDIEESHQVISLRVKDAVVKHGAKLVLVSPRWGELVDFAAAWLQPRPGAEAAAVQALADASAGAPAGVDPDALEAARALLAERPADGDDGAPSCAVVFAPGALSAEAAEAQAAACTNLAVATLGDRAAQSLHYLPTDANVLGISDMGVTPGEGGRSFPEIIEGARDGAIRALLIHDDNPLLNAPGSDDVRAALEAVEALVVIDSVRSTTAAHANVVLAELPFFAKDGTLTTGDRRITRQRPAAQPRRDERDGVAILIALANALGGDFAYGSAGEVMAEAAAGLEGYEPYEAVRSGRTRALSGSPASGASPQPLPASADGAATDGLRLIADRSLYTSWEGASLRSEEADKLHREETLLINPADAEPLGVRSGDELVLANGSHEVRIAAQLDDGVPPGAVYASRYFDGGALMALFPLRGAADAAAAVQVQALQPA